MAMNEIKEQKLDSLIEKVNKEIKIIIQEKSIKLNNVKLSYILQNPMELINNKKNKYDMLLNTLQLLNPLGILEKGYSLTTINKKVIKTSKELKQKDIINIKFHEGEIKAEVKEVN